MSFAAIFGFVDAGGEAVEQGANSQQLWQRFWQKFMDRIAAGDDAGALRPYGKSEVPSWVFNDGYRAEAGETPVQAATRIMNERYGVGKWENRTGSEFSKIKKWISRTGGMP
jgi:hypothetical protein